MADARDVWRGGDYRLVAPKLRPAAEELVRAAGVTRGHDVLDVAAGTGNVSAAASAAGARVTASDFAAVMLEAGRANVPGANWVEADAQDLPFPDARFDRTLSAFGAMFAPDPPRAAAELLRVTKPGGRVGMATWIDDGAQAAANAIIAAQFPQAPSRMAELWGDPDHVRSFFAGAAEVELRRQALRWEFPDAEAYWAYMETGPPPIAAARAAIGEQRWAAVRVEALEAARELGDTSSGGFVIEPPYLVILARP